MVVARPRRVVAAGEHRALRAILDDDQLVLASEPEVDHRALALDRRHHHECEVRVVHPAAFRLDDEPRVRPRLVAVARVDMHARAARLDRGRLAEREAHEVGVVDVEIDDRAARARDIEVEVLAPRRPRTQAPKRRAQRTAEARGAHGLRHPRPRRPEAHAVGGHDQHAGSARLVVELVDQARIERGRLLDEDMLLRANRGPHELDMRVGGRADRDKVDVRAREEFVETRGAWKGGEQRVRATARDEVASGGGTLRRVVEGADGAASGRGVRREMRAAHEAEPDDADADFARGHACGVNTTPLSM